MVLGVNSDEVRRHWAERSGEFSPEYYAHHGPDDASETVRDLLDRFSDPDAAILEVGCGSGRHLSHLYDHGFGNLTGIEINESAFDVLAETYPPLAASGTFYLDAIEDVVGEFEDGQFDAVYSVETLQHLHPDAEWVFAELARITDDLLVTVENEGEDDQRRSTGPDVNYVNDAFPLYYRDWEGIFADLGFVEVETGSVKRNTVRAFRDPADRISEP